MAKCIVTKLPASVNDNNIPKMGVLRVRIGALNSSNADVRYFEVGMSRASKAVVVPDSGSELGFESFAGTSLGSELALVSGVNGMRVSAGTGYVEIYDKYAITSLSGFPMIINVKDLAYCSGLTSLDLRNNYYDNVNDKSHGDITGVVADNVIDSKTLIANAVSYDISRLPGKVTELQTEGNVVGMYCSNTARKGESFNAITTGDTYILFQTANDARNFIIANAGCKWEDRAKPNIRIKTLDDPSYTFAGDVAVISAIETLKGKMVWNGEKGSFVINGILK